MLSLLVLCLITYSYTESYLLRCDFETPCTNFTTDQNWGLTDGFHPRPIDHDHTLNNNSGHYLFYSPISESRFQLAEIKTTDWLTAPTDRAICFQMWYYTPRLSLPFSIQLVQGDDELLTRVIASIPGKDPSVNDWTQINLLLPAEKIKIYVRLNVSVGPLAFDDFTVDYCDKPRPSPPDTLLACDFESYCTDKFISLPEYIYQWSVIEADDAVKQQRQAPPIDYTFGNGSGHYVWLKNSTYIQPGNVAYLATRSSLNLTSNQTYCLNFQYYGYARNWYKTNLKIYSMISNETPVVQMLWPTYRSGEYQYTPNQWTWGIINLPVGYYSLLFRVDYSDIVDGSYALDNIEITSCDYPTSSLTPYDSFLSFSCNFDNQTMCDMTNGDQFTKPTFNFTVMTGDTIPDRSLGPTRDHTSKSSSGGFIYWNRQLPFIPGDNGVVEPSKTIQQNTGMCVRFAYYVKSVVVNRNATSLMLSTGGCYGASPWYRSMDDSQGWQVATVPVLQFACAETFYFSVSQREPFAVSVAFDDIEIAQCSSFDPPTTTTLRTTKTTFSKSHSSKSKVTSKSKRTTKKPKKHHYNY
ncbi:unnamed protein product [Rotaria sp. Silwood2]|nr:unnamed protein product [Rotaria sp. Silwood2]